MLACTSSILTLSVEPLALVDLVFEFEEALLAGQQPVPDGNLILQAAGLRVCRVVYRWFPRIASLGST